MTRRALLTLVLALVLVLSAFLAGRAEGIRHAIEDSCMFAVDCYNPDDPDASAWQGYDLEVFIEIDGQVYSHGLYQG